MANLESGNWDMVKKILRYIKGASNTTLCFEGSKFIDKGYVDSNFTRGNLLQAMCLHL